MQTALIPHLASLPLTPLPTTTLNDYLVSAPTGSGKTLSYGVPIIHVLSSRIVTRLRALIILPTRDLVMQVRETMDELARGTGLKIATATGQHSFSHEQAVLVGAQLNHHHHQKDVTSMTTPDDNVESSARSGGTSKVDILIATPGRLLDHLRETPGFTLQHLRFLVIDEADRLLTQSFQDWLNQVLHHLKPPPPPPPTRDATAMVAGRQTHMSGIVAPSWYDDLGLGQGDWEGKRSLRHPVRGRLFSFSPRPPCSLAHPAHLHLFVWLVSKTLVFRHLDAGSGQDCCAAARRSKIFHCWIRQDRRD